MNHEVVTEKIKIHDERLGNHSDRIKRLEKKEAAQAVQIENLCKTIERQIKAMYVLGGIFLTSLVGFFFYALQVNLFYR